MICKGLPMIDLYEIIPQISALIYIYNIMLNQMLMMCVCIYIYIYIYTSSASCSFHLTRVGCNGPSFLSVLCLSDRLVVCQSCPIDDICWPWCSWSASSFRSIHLSIYTYISLKVWLYNKQAKIISLNGYTDQQFLPV